MGSCDEIGSQNHLPRRFEGGHAGVVHCTDTNSHYCSAHGRRPPKGAPQGDAEPNGCGADGQDQRQDRKEDIVAESKTG